MILEEDIYNFIKNTEIGDSVEKCLRYWACNPEIRSPIPPPCHWIGLCQTVLNSNFPRFIHETI